MPEETVTLPTLVWVVGDERETVGVTVELPTLALEVLAVIPEVSAEPPMVRVWEGVTSVLPL